MSAAAGGTAALDRPMAVGWLIAAVWLIGLAFHLPSFHRSGFNGDEVVFLALSREMHWDGSHYTTMDAQGINAWPNSIYRQPLFHHGPVLPYLLKLGRWIGHPTLPAFAFALGCLALFGACVLRWCRLLDAGPAWTFAASALAATDPLLIFSTTRLHVDGTSGLLLASGLVLSLDALRSRSAAKAVAAGIAFAIAMNLRATAVIALPVMGLAWLVFEQGRLGALLRRREAWITATIALAFGGWHTFRLLATYGTLDPSVLLVPDESHAWYRMLARQGAAAMLLNLALMLPMLCLLPTPLAARALARWRHGTAPAAAMFGAALLVLLALFLADHREIRFFAMFAPLLVCLVPALGTLAGQTGRRAIFALLAIALACNLVVATLATLARPDQNAWMLPALYEFVPALQPLYGPTTL